MDGLDVPEAFVTNERDVAGIPMPDTDERWVTTRFVDPTDLRHDMHVNIVTFEPGAVIPFAETHVMEHGLYVLEGKAVYRLNQDWVEVQEGDFMWLRAFCPQACYAGGPGPVPLPAVQGRQPARPAQPPVPLTRPQAASSVVAAARPPPALGRHLAPYTEAWRPDTGNRISHRGGIRD